MEMLSQSSEMQAAGHSQGSEKSQVNRRSYAEYSEMTRSQNACESQTVGRDGSEIEARPVSAKLTLTLKV
jgi:hypothetical protein